MNDDNRISTYAGRYALNMPSLNCPTTFQTDPALRIQKNGDSWPTGMWRTDVESSLRGVDRFSSRVRCDAVLYNPVSNPVTNTPLENAPDEYFHTVYGRLEDPACTLRGTGWNRFEWLHHNPQETFETPFDFFIPSRWLDAEKMQTHAPWGHRTVGVHLAPPMGQSGMVQPEPSGCAGPGGQRALYL